MKVILPDSSAKLMFMRSPAKSFRIRISVSYNQPVSETVQLMNQSQNHDCFLAQQRSLHRVTMFLEVFSMYLPPRTSDGPFASLELGL